MSATTTDRLLDTCERVLRQVGTDAEAEVTVTAGTESLTRFATSFIHQNVTDAARLVHLRVAVDGRVAEATATQDDDEALARLVRATLDAARLQPVDPAWPGLAPPAEAAAVEHWDDATADADPDERRRAWRAPVARARRRRPGWRSPPRPAGRWQRAGGAAGPHRSRSGG